PAVANDVQGYYQPVAILCPAHAREGCTGRLWQNSGTGTAGELLALYRHGGLAAVVWSGIIFPMCFMRRLLESLIILTLLAASPATAKQEPPTRVGRVSFVSGNLAFHMVGETQWIAAAVNYPVATGGSFWTDPESRTEMRIGPNAVDIAGSTELDVA